MSDYMGGIFFVSPDISIFTFNKNLENNKDEVQYNL